MNILKRSREEIQSLVDDGLLKKEYLKFYDVCKDLKKGLPQEKVAEKHGYADDRWLRRIKTRECPDCNKIQ